MGVPYVQLGGMFDSSHVRDGSAGDAGSRRVEVSEESARRDQRRLPLALEVSPPARIAP